MLGFLLVIGTCLVGLAVLINPKIGAVLVWPVLLLYPHLLLERMGLLPWNIGLDDLFICSFFLIVVVRRNLLGGVPLRLGLCVLGTMCYFVLWAVAHASGWRMMPELFPIDVVKPVLKYGIYVLFVYVMIHTIDNERDLRRSALTFVVCMMLAGLTVILQQYFPAQMAIFTSEKVETLRRWHGGVTRAVGSLAGANTACAILGMAAIFAVTTVRTQTTPLRRVLLVASVPILLAAMVLTESRTGAIALGVTVIIMGFVSRSKLYAWGIVCMALLVALVRPALLLDFWERFAAIYTTDVGGQLDPNAQTRIDLWREYFASATPQILFLGQGRLVPILLHGSHPHSTYVSALLLHGIGGVIWFAAFFGILVRRGVWLARYAIEPYRSIGSGVLWGMMAWAIAGLTLDMLVTPYPRYVYLFFAVLIERSYVLAREAPQPLAEQSPAVTVAGLARSPSAAPWPPVPQ